MNRSLKGAPSLGLGVIAALMALEVGLARIVTAGLPPVPSASRDAFDAPSIVTRQIEEGIAAASFSTSGARLTGNQPIHGAPVIVVLGDSYVVAREVRDEQTMGAWIEKLARASDVDVNVRQYGWRGASAPQYLTVAKEVIQRWNPAQVVVVLSEDDLGADPLNRNFPRMTIGKGDEVRTVPAPPSTSDDSGSIFLRRSALVALLRARWQRVLERAPASIQRITSAQLETRGPAPESHVVEAVPRATVKSLWKAFGSTLTIVYAADVRVNFGHEMEGGERRLLAACDRLRVRCVSARAAMLAARQRGIVARGFSTTTLGVGHLNAAGHEIIARSVWVALQPRMKGTEQLASGRPE